MEQYVELLSAVSLLSTTIFSLLSQFNRKVTRQEMKTERKLLATKTLNLQY